jgi:hypothetical protein
MGLFRKTPPLPSPTREIALACSPVRNPGVKENRLESGCLLLEYPVALKPWMTEVLRRFKASSPVQQMRKLELDELGSATWELIDGNRSVDGIVKCFADAYRLHPKEAELSVTRFLFELGKRGLIAMR